MSDEYQKALSSIKNINAVKAGLKTQLEEIMTAIEAAQKKLSWLQNSYLPIDDLKESIIQFLAAKGQEYQSEIIRPAISDLAHNKLWGTSGMKRYGMTLAYQEIEDAIEGIKVGFSACQIISPNKSYHFDDRAFFALLFVQMEPVLRSIIENMKPEEFGYNKITAKEIGPGLEERRQMIGEIAQEILALEQAKTAVIGKLESLGENVKNLLSNAKTNQQAGLRPA
ncbi:MAG: hypothetical protein KF888_12265 [Nitrosomonas sp.]|nr:hypothetical protein [Nitrosomonas sp.]